MTDPGHVMDRRWRPMDSTLERRPRCNPFGYFFVSTPRERALAPAPRQRTPLIPTEEAGALSWDDA
jgi:hypothetical protein